MGGTRAGSFKVRNPLTILHTSAPSRGEANIDHLCPGQPQRWEADLQWTCGRRIPPASEGCLLFPRHLPWPRCSKLAKEWHNFPVSGCCLPQPIRLSQVPLTGGLVDNPPTPLPGSTLQRPTFCRCCFPWALPHKRACCLFWDLETWLYGDGGSRGNKCWQHRCRL